MMQNIESRGQIEKLVSKYRNLSTAERKQYNEANTKNGFVQPFFEALGWNFSDINEVEAEKTILKGRVDFICKLNNVSKFCLEVKTCRDDLTDNDRKQAINYAYMKGGTWAVLTNFDRLQVFNAERETTNPNEVLFTNLTWKDYLTSFEEIWLLSKESMKGNLLDQKAIKYGKLPMRIPVEKRLYLHLRKYRESLFNELYKMHRDKGITLKQTDILIQELINRLLFIRTAEDRNLAGNHPLLSALHRWRTEKKGELVDQIKIIFQQFAQQFDSDLFPTALDHWAPIWISSELLANIIQGLYEVPGDFARYDFSVIDADVIGQVYEQYLGYVAQIAKERAKQEQLRMDLGFPVTEVIMIEEKKLKRKAAGIYYTPRWVTDYIVKQTVGRFLQENSYDIVEQMKIVDPSCGSGSFLIRAYDELLNYHAKIKNKTVADLGWKERITILTNNIFGADSDYQATEITKLSLLLRALAEADLLPSLAENIQCGNSLISGSEALLTHCFGKNWQSKNPINWETRFPDIMKQGGFDIVVGNPPYVNESRGNKTLFRELKVLPYLQKYYEKNMDLFNYFIELGIDLLKDGGLLGYIIPAYWQDRTGATLLRGKIDRETNVEHLVNLGEFKVFVGAPGQHNNIIILRKTPTTERRRTLSYVEIAAEGSTSDKDVPRLTEPSQREYALVNSKLLIGQRVVNLIQRMQKGNVFCLHKDEVMRGVDTGGSTSQGKGVFVLTESEYQKLCKDMTSKQRHEFFKPFYEANQIDRYYGDPKNHHWLLYTDSRRKKLLENDSSKYQTIVNHLDKFKDAITSDNKPYGLHRPKKEASFLDSSKILFVRKTPYPKFALVPIPCFVDESVYLINWHRPEYDIRYLLAIFNSKLAKWWFSRQKKHGEQLQIDKEQIVTFPIPCVDSNNRSEIRRYKLLVFLVDKLLKLVDKFVEEKVSPTDILGEETKKLANDINKINNKIDELVYRLYDITEADKETMQISTGQ